MKLDWKIIVALVILAVVIIWIVSSYNERKKEEAREQTKAQAQALASLKEDKDETTFGKLWENIGGVLEGIFPGQTNRNPPTSNTDKETNSEIQRLFT